MSNELILIPQDGATGDSGATGATGATGPAGPNVVSGSTSTSLNGLLRGTGSAVATTTIGVGAKLDSGVLEAPGCLSPHYSVDSTVYDFGPNTNASINVGLVANRKYLVAWHNSVRRTITEVMCVVGTAGAAGTLMRLGMRNRSATGVPTTLIADFGTVSVASTGSRTITGLSVTIDPGIYYLEIVTDGAPFIRGFNTTAQIMPLGAVASTNTINTVNGLFRAFTFAALPADETSQSQTLISGGSVPTFGVR